MRITITCKQLIRDFPLVQDRLSASGMVVSLADVPGQHLEGSALREAIRDSIGVIAGDDRFSRQVLEASPRLRVISRWGVGTDGIDPHAAALGIVVRNTPGMFDDEVADVTMAYIVDVCRHITRIDRSVRVGDWFQPPGRSLRGLTLGIIGLGGIGRAVARRAAVAGMAVTGTDPDPVSAGAAAELGVSLRAVDRLLEESDVISVNAPLTPQTHHLLDERAFSRMKRGVRIVNTGRGPIIKTAALLRALNEGVVAAAALDVMEQEPIPSDHPLLQYPQVTLGAHNSSNSSEACLRTHHRAIDNLLDALSGQDR